MLSKKSFGDNKRNFLKLLMRFVRSDVRDHIASQKNDHDLRIDTKEHRNGEIFGVVRFSTFSTASTQLGSRPSPAAARYALTSISLFKEAIALDPALSIARAYLATIMIQGTQFGWIA